MRLILATDDEGNIGKNGGLPWPHVPEDLTRFKRLTMGCAVVMGRKTWDSLPKKPLPGRINVIVSRTMGIPREPEAGYVVCRSLQEAAVFAGPNAWLIGGAEMFNEAVEQELVSMVDLTVHHGNFGGDVKWKVPEHYTLLKGDPGNVLSRFIYSALA